MSYNGLNCILLVINPKSLFKTCEVCGAQALHKVLDLGLHPMCDDLIRVGDSSESDLYPISILHCTECNTAHQEFQIPKTDLFPASYHYRSRLTSDVLSGMRDLVDSVETCLESLEGLVVLDIGCNDGSLLDFFRSKKAITIGVESTGAASDANNKGHLIINEFFTAGVANHILETHNKIDIITFTNVFAHIEDLQELLRSLNILLSSSTLLVIENHYLGSVLSENQFDTFYHEHPRTYSLGSFMRIADCLEKDLLSVQFPKRYGGNIRVFIGNNNVHPKEANKLLDEVLDSELAFSKGFISMNDFINSWKISKLDEIRQLVSRHGKLVAKAFPGRAAILVTLLGLTDNEIECIYEKPSSPKIDCYVPGTRIPIKSDDELFERITNLPIILNFAWHIPQEIATYLNDKGFDGDIIHIM